MKIETLIRKNLDKDIEETEIESKNFYMDKENVFSFIPKNERFERALEETNEFNKQKLEQIKNTVLDKDCFVECNFGADFLKILFSLTEKDETVKLKIAKNFPLVAETKNFTFVLAPRITE